jgi:hypothetical protein
VRKPALSWLVAALAVGLGAGCLGLSIADRGAPAAVAGMEAPDAGVTSTLFVTAMLTLFAAMGALVAWRRPRNPVGWLLLTTALSFGALVFAEGLGWHNLVATGEPAPSVTYWLWLANWAWIPAVVPIFIYLPLVFPTGRPLSPRWRRFLWAVSIVVVVFTVTSALSPGPLANYRPLDNPVGTVHAATVVQNVTFAMVLVAAIVSLASLALRFRRSRGVERQQIKWVWAAAGVLVVSFALSGLLQTVNLELSNVIMLAGLLGIPAAVAVAVLRYRLYDIAVVVNRTLVYASLTVSLAVVYLGSVLLLQLVLDPVTSGSSLAIAVSTLAVAGLFRPVRARIQGLVDRRFYRRKYDTARTLEAFNARLRDEVDLDSLARELRGVLQDTMQPAHVSVWLKPPGRV